MLTSIALFNEHARQNTGFKSITIALFLVNIMYEMYKSGDMIKRFTIYLLYINSLYNEAETEPD